MAIERKILDCFVGELERPPAVAPLSFALSLSLSLSLSPSLLEGSINGISLVAILLVPLSSWCSKHGGHRGVSVTVGRAGAAGVGWRSPVAAAGSIWYVGHIQSVR